jgi:hypothetical protein
VACLTRVYDWRDLRNIPMYVKAHRIGDVLPSYCRYLEDVVAPYITTKKTSDIIAFKGKRRYINRGPKNVYLATMALQSVYHLLAEREAGHATDAAIHAAFCVIEYTTRLVIFEEIGVDTYDACYALTLRRVGCSKGGKRTTKLTLDQAQLARAIFIQAKDGNAKLSDECAYQRTRTRLAKEHGIAVSVSTLRRRLYAQR